MKKPKKQISHTAMAAATSASFPVVGIGASAGGLEALETFFRNVPEHSGIAYIVIQHLSPDYKSLMGELLSRHTPIPVQTASDGLQIEPDHIYLIPPKKNMTIFSGRLYLVDPPGKTGLNLPIDIFFRSLAQERGKNAVAIVLSGTGSDGTLGIRAIKEAGGMVFAQDDTTAKFDGMPKSSIATGMVDYVGSPAEMPQVLIRYIQHPIIAKAEHKKEMDSNDSVLLRILKVIRDRVGVDFTFYKPNTIVRRLEKRIGINQLTDYSEYLRFLENSPAEANILYKDLLIGVTQFFRDTEAFQIVKEELIPNILASKSRGDQVRVWIVGCSTGEEAYSIAILLMEYMEAKDLHLDLKIFATDLDKEHITIAGNGIYPDSIVADVIPDLLRKYFVRTNNRYRVNDTLRRTVIFAQQNIIKDPPFSKIDLISCRNMLIYLNQEMQRRIIAMFYQSLVNGGGLFLGSSESLGDLSEGFETLHSKWKIFRQKPGYHPPIGLNYLIPQSKIKSPQWDHRSSAAGAPTQRGAMPESVLAGLLENVLPPSVMVDESFNVIHVFNEVNEFLKVPSGKASLDILSMVRKEISVVLGSMLHKSLKDNKKSVFKEVKLDAENLINIITQPFEDLRNKRRYVLVSFEKADQNGFVTPPDSKDFDINTHLTNRFIELEKDLQFTKENLQATIEELETSNEELQSTNEELIASNEELQSTNEELQSVNEELYTVNTEYQQKIEELTQLNNDMNNLLKNTSIGILYLDRKLRIRKYTTMVTRVVNVMEMDIGRPIQHISLNVPYEHFIRDVEEVLHTLAEKEMEFKDTKGNWNLIRILPYRNQDNAMEGITVTVIDISQLKAKEATIARQKDLFYSVLDNSPIGKMVLDQAGNIIYVNKMTEELTGFRASELTNRNYNDARWHIEDSKEQQIPEEELPFNKVVQEGLVVQNYLMLIKNAKKEKLLIRVNGAPMLDDKKEISGAIFSIEKAPCPDMREPK